jgi:ATP-dependent Zn protease
VDPELTFEPLTEEVSFTLPPERGGSSGRRSPSEPSLQLLAGLALDRVWTPDLARDLERHHPLVIIVEVPASVWSNPVRDALARRVSPRRIEFTVLQTRPKDAGGPALDLDAAHAVAAKSVVVAIAPDATWLSPVMVAAADHRLQPAPLSPDVVTEAIRRWTGRKPRIAITSADLAGLDLPDVAAALRPGATAAMCRRRLQAASRTRIGRPQPGSSSVPLAALAGSGEAFAWAEDLVRSIERVKVGALPVSALEGCVLYGSPGTGKTALARAVASEAGVPFQETSVGGWFSSSSGNLDGVVKAIDKFCDSLHVMTKSSGVAIGFVDELDALPNRERLSNRGADWWLPVVTHALIRFEKLRKSGVVLIGATNHLSRIDAALLRPGRFDQAIEVLPPDKAGRELALLHHLAGDLAGVDLDAALRLSRGATGATLAAAVRAARRRADAAGRAMELADLLAAIDPADTRPPDVIRSAALHEAAHAAVALRLGMRVVQVSIVAGPGSGGSTTLGVDDPTPGREAVERQVVVALAGRAADTILGAGPDAGSGSDLFEATGLLASLHASWGLGDRLTAALPYDRAREVLTLDGEIASAVEKDLVRLSWVAEWMVTANASAIEELAGALIQARVLTGEEVAAIVDRHPPRLRVKAVTRQGTFSVKGFR